MSDQPRDDARSRAAQLHEHLIHPETDSVSHAELWDVLDLPQVGQYLVHLDRELDRSELALRDAIMPLASCSEPPVAVRGDPGGAACTVDLLLERDNHAQVSRRLRHFNELQRKRRALFDYQQRRIIKERMESLFGVRLYGFIERAIFALIIFVVAVLVVEFSMFDDLFQIGVANPDVYHQARPFAPIGQITLWQIALFDLAAGGIFLTEYFLRWAFSADKAWYVRNHKIDLISSIPLTGIFIVLGVGAIIPDLMALRVLRLLRVFRAIRIASFFWRGMERLEQVASIKMMRKSLLIMLWVIVIGTGVWSLTEGKRVEMELGDATVATDAGVATHAEAATMDGQDPRYATDAKKQFWWTVTTLTTAGFGDLWTPRTTAGWVVTLFLVITGIVVVGVFTAALTSIFRGDDTQELVHLHQQLQEYLEAQAANTRRSLDELGAQVAQLRASNQAGKPTDMG